MRRVTAVGDQKLDLSSPMAAEDQIRRLRSRAAHYRNQAGRAGERRRRIYCRALASHLEAEASELARLSEAST